jgi:drug/metabolite transporter (DMT)-like permease
MSKRRLKAYTFLILTVIIWGIAGPVIKFTLEGIDPLPFLTYRLFISTIISLVFFMVKIKKGKKFNQLKANFPASIVYGLLAVPLALGLLFLGLDNTTVLDMTLISVIGPVVVMAGGALFFRDRITKREKLGISIVLLGVLLNSLFPIIRAEGIKLTANILLIAYLITDSASVLVAKRLSRRRVNSGNLTNLAFIIGFLTLLPVTIYSYGWQGLYGQVTNMALKYHLGVWYMAILSGSIAYFLYIRAQKSIEISEAILFNYMAPVVAIPLAVFWLNESLSLHFVLGALLIAVGLVIAQSKKKRYNS